MSEDADLVSCERRIVDFVRRASTEITPQDDDLLQIIAGELPGGTVVYVAQPPQASLDDVVRVATKVQYLGLTASPHIVARRIPSERALKAALDELRDADVDQLLLVAGDADRPLGKFTSSLEILDTAALQEAGFRRIGVAGHPDGHRAVGPEGLLAALRYKQEFARKSGIPVHIVTQFGFNPEAVCSWSRHLSEEGITLPVHVGIAGPTPLPKLLKFAMHCGVKASMHLLMSRVSAISTLARPIIAPDEMLASIVKGRAAHAASRLVQPHFYSFGGAVATARWLRKVMKGEFTLKSDGAGFATLG